MSIFEEKNAGRYIVDL